MKSQPVTLLVDNQETLDYMQPMLEEILDQPRLIHCASRDEAMRYIDSHEYADVILADWELTGYKFIDRVRRDIENHNTPIIIMSEDTTIKKIVLKEIDREATFFLTKPFLEKGLKKKFNKVLNSIERRRKNRVHPASPVALEVEFGSGQVYTLALVDISIDGCLFRIPLETSRELSVYQPADVRLAIDEFDIKVNGEVYRLGHDRARPDTKDTVLAMIKLSQPDRQSRALEELMDELGRRW